MQRDVGSIAEVENPLSQFGHWPFLLWRNLTSIITSW